MHGARNKKARCFSASGFALAYAVRINVELRLGGRRKRPGSLRIQSCLRRGSRGSGRLRGFLSCFFSRLFSGFFRSSFLNSLLGYGFLSGGFFRSCCFLSDGLFRSGFFRSCCFLGYSLFRSCCFFSYGLFRSGFFRSCCFFGGSCFFSRRFFHNGFFGSRFSCCSFFGCYFFCSCHDFFLLDQLEKSTEGNTLRMLESQSDSRC